ncbi:MAG TPA: HAMP domain-containing sensor histidine kinase, partial [Polyangiaceae bacterium]|nr:HAMP domain-containing sensor histidine kinase [Polyangiaceae bacterium]
MILPAVLVAVGVLAYFTFRTTLQVERLRQQSVLEATLGLANEKADRLDARIIEQDNVVFAIADPQRLSDLTLRWLPTAQRETPTVRAILVLDESRTVLAFASRAGGVFAEEEAFRRLLVQRMCGDMELAKQEPDELRHLHRAYRGQSYLVSYWQRVVAPAPDGSGAGASSGQQGRRYLVVAWHDIGRIVKDTMPTLFSEAATPSRVNVLDEDGRIIFGPPLRSSEFTVAVRFPTTLYGWRVQVSPSASDELTARVQNRAMLELVMVVLSCAVIVLGVATILLAAERERRISALKSDFVANVSHELKTPLALVRMFGEMLQSGRVTSDEKRQQYLDIIVSESERLSSLIENVLDFARVERGREAYDFSEGDVGEAVAKAVNVYRYRAEREGVDLAIELGADLPRTRIDGRALELAVINLIDNALKYAPDSDVVTVRVERESGSIVVRVVDCGPGVPIE